MTMPPTMIPDNSAILKTTPYIPYMTNPSAVWQQQQQQQQQQHYTSMASPSSFQVATKQSKAIKIVNPETMKEVDSNDLKKSSPASSSHSTPKPTAESGQVEQQLKQTVDAAVDSKDNKVCYISR